MRHSLPNADFCLDRAVRFDGGPLLVALKPDVVASDLEFHGITNDQIASWRIIRFSKISKVIELNNETESFPVALEFKEFRAPEWSAVAGIREYAGGQNYDDDGSVRFVHLGLNPTERANGNT